MTAPTLPSLQPRSPTEVVDAAVQLIRGHFGYFLMLAAVGAIPLLVVSIAQAVIAPLPTLTAPTPATVSAEAIWWFLPFQLLLVVFGTVQSAAVLVAGFRALQAEPLPTIGAAYSQAMRRAVNILLVYLLAGVIGGIALLPVVLAVGVVAGPAGAVGGVVLALLALVALMAGGLLLLAVITLANTLVVVESLGPVRALRRAWALSSGSRWRQVAVWGITYLVLLVALIALVALASTTANAQVMAVLNVLVLVPISPFLGGVMLTSYADLRARREGADLDAELTALGNAG